MTFIILKILIHIILKSMLVPKTHALVYSYPAGHLGTLGPQI